MSEKKGKVGKTMVYGLMGLLFVGLGGFGATNFSGTVRSVGSVGDTDIDITEYSRALQNEIRAVEAQTGQPLTFQQAQLFGLPQRALSQMVVTTALENEAREIGISIGDTRLADDLRNVQAFQGPDGQFNRDSYRFALDNAGLSEREFEEGLRSESASTILQGSVLAGVRLPDTYINTLIDFAQERRAFTWARVSLETLTTGVTEATQEELRAWYDDNIDRFTIPETKQLTYVWLTPDMILDSVEVDEESLRAAYEEREAEFNLPERRLVERLVFGDDAEAQAASERLTAGEITFEDLVTERGLQLADVDLGDVTVDDLGAAAEAVFAAEVGAVSAPAASDFGPALFRVNAVLPAQSTSYEEALPDLRDSLALDRARRVIDGQAQSFDDELAAGATIEELAEGSDLALATMGWTGANAEDAAGYEAFRDLATSVADGDYPTIGQLGDGGIFALRLDEVTPATPRPFEEVRDDVLGGWEQSARLATLVEFAQTQADQIETGADFASLNLDATSEEGLTRNAAGNDMPIEVLEAVFALEAGQAIALASGDGAVIVKLDTIIAADREDETAQMLRNFYSDQAANDVSEDLFRALATDIQTRAGVEINQAAINAVHANFQ